MKKVLIVEDENYLQAVLQEELSKKGFETHHANFGKLGWQLALSNKPDVILLDLMLPGSMTGLKLLETLGKDKQTKNIPVIVTTNLEDMQEQTKELGAVECVLKADMSLDQLVKLIRKYTDLQ